MPRFQAAVGSELADSRHKLNVRVGAAHFDSEEGGLEARDILHQQDLKQPCRAACTVAPREYELNEIPDPRRFITRPSGASYPRDVPG